ncbi:transmembrane protein 222-like [Hyposmocoma kahamanoa]|uniref:transmembrane protein 222-like n=1 Tax=Hyposmocoma kahamanoa TaxID=1477025 RepID=UPI000E6D5F5B|nr:transmembrane protein 222-like [Hyposmocoma kahamanoa]
MVGSVVGLSCVPYQQSEILVMMNIDHKHIRYPHCIVWTPIPLLTWFCPLLGHMGIAYSSGVIRDFSSSYTVSVDDFAFGKPTKYWQLTPNKVHGGQDAWDGAIDDASNIYSKRRHNICCDNCHSHVATALNIMKYDNSNNWNMVKLAFFMIPYSKYVSCWAFVKTWLPFVLAVVMIIVGWYISTKTNLIQ